MTTAMRAVEESSEYPLYPVDSLCLDPQNPRLVEYGATERLSQFDILKMLWDKMAVAEVAMSIAHNGYFRHEPLFAEVNEEGERIVIEGNRRLAAVKLLLDARLRKQLRATDLPDIDRIDKGRRAQISALPVVMTTRRDVWRYLGFKHVNGPATWGSYAKAQYVARVHNEYGVPLTDIAAQIGDYNHTVERMYRGLMVIEQAERANVFNRRDAYRNDFYFNYIYTALDYPGYQRYLGLVGKSRMEREPVPHNRVKHLGEICEWLYGSRSRDRPSVIKSQNPDLKTLDAILLDEKGVKALRDGLPLNVARDISLGDEHLFRAALQQAKQALQRARGTLTTGFRPDDANAYQTATEIEKLAVDLVDEMNIKRRPRPRSHRQETREDV